MRVLESAVVGFALAVVVIGTVLGALVAPPFTRVLVRRLDVAAEAGLAPALAESVAEQVRRFVTDRAAPALPSQLEGRPAFDEAAVAHLKDVREVMLGARRLTGVLAAGLTAWLIISIARRRFGAVASALITGAACCIALPVLGAVVGLTDFEWFFSGFHALFFESGTWTFPYDALLIRLFPEAFWASAAVAWGLGVVLGGLVLGVAGAVVRSAARAPAAAPPGAAA